MTFRITCPNCKERITIENAGSSTIVCPKCKCAYLINIVKNGDKHELESLRLLFNPKDVKRIDIIKDKWKHLSTKIKIGIPVLLIIITACIIGWHIYIRPCPIEETMAYADMKSLWKEFRKKNPYNFQIAGIKQYDDSSYTMILSEPSEMVKVEDLQKFFKKYNCNLDTFKHSIGYDGWLKDAVICFNGISKRKLPNLTSSLFKLLYGTDYKAELMDLDTIPEHTAFSTHDLNYQVTAEELHSWFIDNREPIINISNTTKETYIENALKNNKDKSDLYYSKNPGFVIWVIKRSSSLDSEDFKVKARMFALDSDLILGAISNSGRVAIIARERSIPIYGLPPMRQETLLMLASTDKEELSQSFERNSLFAGKLPGGKDYAPILLSDELWHTEYGNILNITDQMLKSWSENGEIEYEGFNYPKPIDWAFHDGAKKDLGVNELTYNWNTAGAGYTIPYENINIYAVNRTGSLPVSYIPGKTDKISENDLVYRAEEKAYNFFSGLSSPELVKVVQYASMFQIFKQYGVHIKRDSINTNKIITPEIIYNKSERVLYRISTISNTDVELVAQKLGYEAADLNSRPRLFKKGSSQSNLSLVDSIDSLSCFLNNINENKLLIFLAHFLVDREVVYEERTNNSNPYNISPQFLLSMLGVDTIIERKENYIDKMPFQKRINYTRKTICKYAWDIQEFNRYVNILSPSDAKSSYLQCNKDKSDTWMKCPTIVESWQVKDSAFAIGGHNLSSNVTPVKINESLKPGEYDVVKIDDYHKSIEIPASGRGYVTGDLIRIVERTGIEGKHRFNKSAKAIKARSVVFPHTAERSARGFNKENHLMIGREEKFYTINDKKSGFTVEDLLKVVTDKLDNGEAHTSVTLEFRSICEDECMAIVEGLGSVRFKKSPAFSKIPCRALDVNNIITEDCGNGIIRVKVAVKPEEVLKLIANEDAQQASLEGVASKKSYWSRVKEIFIIFEVPKAMVEKFKSYLQTYVKKHPVFRYFEFRQDAKEMIQGELNAIKAAQINYYQKKDYNGMVLEEKNVA